MIIINKLWFKYLPSLILGVLIIAYYLPNTPCFSLELFGLPCSFCGGTRSFISFHKLDWTASFSFNPLVFMGLIISWFLGILGVLSSYNNYLYRIFEKIYRFINNNFFILFTIVIVLYFIQLFIRIIYH